VPVQSRRVAAEPRLMPFGEPPELASEAVPESRLALFVPGEVTRITLPATGEALPWLASSADHLRQPWHKFELPGLEPTARRGRSSELIQVLIHYADGTRKPWTMDWPISSGDAMHHAEQRRALAQLADRRQSLIHDLEQRQSQQRGVFRAGRNGEGLAVPLDRLAWLWPEHEAVSAGRYELVHAWADRLERAIKHVCRTPRTALVHQRNLVNANRLQAMDAHCLRWLARQPGTTTVERAGPRQQVMGLTRTEQIATLENRTAAQVMRAIKAECQRVLDDAEPEAPRHEPVRRLARVIDRMCRESPVPHLADPVPGVRANHVLRHDRRYRLLWQAQLELRHRDQRQTEAWHWRHRLWAESCLLAIACRVQQSFPASPAGRSCLVFERRPEQGRIVDETTALGRYEIGSAAEPASVLLIERGDLPRFRGSALVPEALIAMSPDAVLIHRSTGQADEREVTRIGVWAQWRPHERGEAEPLRQRCERTAHLLQQAGSDRMRGLLIEPIRPTAEAASPEAIQVAADPRGVMPHGRSAASGACHGLALPLPMIGGWAALGHALRQVLE